MPERPWRSLRWLSQSVRKTWVTALKRDHRKLGRELKENPTGVAAKGMVLALASAALALSNDDDDRYKELPEWEKDTFWHIFNGDDHYRIPKPFELGLEWLVNAEKFAKVREGAYHEAEREAMA